MTNRLSVYNAVELLLPLFIALQVLVLCRIGLVCCLQAEAVEEKLKAEQLEKVALQKEMLQLKLISAEAEEAGSNLREQLAEVQKALACEQAEHRATSTALSDLRDSLVNREQQLTEARQLLDSMSAELGILSSRFHRLQQERDALRAARLEAQRQQLQQQWLAAQQQRSSQLSCQPELDQLPGATAAVARQQGSISCTVSQEEGLSFHTVEGVSTDVPGPTAATGAGPGKAATSSQPGNHMPSDAHLKQLHHVISVGSSSVGAHAAAVSAVVGGQASALSTGNAEEPAATEGRRDEPVVLCGHDQLEAACLLCICQRFLAATAGSCSLLQPRGTSAAGAAANTPNKDGQGAKPPLAAPASSSSSSGPAVPTPAGLATVVFAACASEAAQYRQYLSISELARNRLEADNASLQQQLTDLQGQVEQQQQQLRVLQAEPVALAACSIQELNTLEGELGPL